MIEINKKVLQNGIYTNEAECVLAGEITLEEAKAITNEFNRLVETSEVKLVSEEHTFEALAECVKLAK